MKLYSRIGEPFYSFSLEKQEWLKNEKIDGFSIPFNLFDNVHGLFRRFSLWQSSNGICRKGVLHKPLHRTRMTIYNKIPILVGDQLEDGNSIKTITYAENLYREENFLWKVTIVCGVMPEPQIPIETPDCPKMLQNFIDTHKEIIAMISNFFDSFLNEIVPLCQVLTQAGPQNVQPALAIPKLQALKTKHENELKNILEKTQESTWR